MKVRCGGLQPLKSCVRRPGKIRAPCGCRRRPCFQTISPRPSQLKPRRPKAYAQGGYSQRRDYWQTRHQQTAPRRLPRLPKSARICTGIRPNVVIRSPLFIHAFRIALGRLTLQGVLLVGSGLYAIQVTRQFAHPFAGGGVVELSAAIWRAVPMSVISWNPYMPPDPHVVSEKPGRFRSRHGPGRRGCR